MYRILYINVSDRGSTGNIIKDTVGYITKYDWSASLIASVVNSDCSIFNRTYKTSIRYEQGLYKRLTKFSRNFYGFAPLSTIRILRIIKQQKPDIVHIHCSNSHMVNVYTLLEYLKKHDVRTVVTNHAEFYYTGHCSYSKNCDNWKSGCNNCPQENGKSMEKYRQNMKRVFNGFNRIVVTSVSPWVLERSKVSPIMNGLKQVLVENGIDTSIYQPRSSSIREKYNLDPDVKVILHITSHFSTDPTHIKGGHFINDLALRMKDEKIIFLVVGTHDDSKTEPNIILCGPIYDRTKIAEYYSVADVTLLVSQRETFSMPVAESLCCGTPVIGFKAGGPESIAIPEYSCFLEYGDLEGMTNMILNKMINLKSQAGCNIISRKAEIKFSSQSMAKNYLDIYNDLMTH